MQTRDVEKIDHAQAHKYKQQHIVQMHAARNFIHENDYLITGPTLELGCALGEDTVYLAKKIPVPVIAVDKSKPRVDYAKEHNQHANIKYITADALELDRCKKLKNMKFSTVISCNTIHQIAKDKQPVLFYHARQFLEPNGVALFLITGRSRILHTAIDNIAKSGPWKVIFESFDFTPARTYEKPEYYRQLGMKAGFYYCSASTNETDPEVELSEEQLKNYLEGWLPHVGLIKRLSIPENHKNHLIDIFLCGIVHEYFVILGKNITSPVNVRITRNKLVMFATQDALLKHIDKMKPEEQEKARSFMLRAKL